PACPRRVRPHPPPPPVLVLPGRPPPLAAPEEAPRPAGHRGPAHPPRPVTPVEDGGMRIGVFLVAAGFPGMEAGEVVRNTVEAVVAAEEAGFDDAWIAEHHFMSYGVCPSAATLAGVALGRTRRITVGTEIGRAAWRASGERAA